MLMNMILFVILKMIKYFYMFFYVNNVHVYFFYLMFVIKYICVYKYIYFTCPYMKLHTTHNCTCIDMYIYCNKILNIL